MDSEASFKAAICSGFGGEGNWSSPPIIEIVPAKPEASKTGAAIAFIPSNTALGASAHPLFRTISSSAGSKLKELPKAGIGVPMSQPFSVP